jgi:hypothetical protein
MQLWLLDMQGPDTMLDMQGTVPMLDMQGTDLMLDMQGADPREKMQKERLQEEFTRALDNFQRLQRQAAEAERAHLAEARYGHHTQQSQVQISH